MTTRARPSGTSDRIALVAACRFPAPRGSQVLIDGMARAFAASGAETHLVAPVPSRVRRPYRLHPVMRDGSLAPSADPTAAPHVLRAMLDGALVARLAAFVRAERPQVLHAHNYEALLAALLVRNLYRVPVVFHCHAVLADELPLYVGGHASRRRRAERLGAWFDAVLPRRADHVVALSHDVAAYLRVRGVDDESLSVVPPAVDAAPFASARPGRRDRRAVFAGNLDAYQGVDLLLRAWSQARVPRDAELRIVTHAAPDRRLLEMTRLLGPRVRLCRARSLGDVAEELGRAAVGVSPRSSWSGFPMKTLNYMASALPTIALAPSAKGVVAGETGWVVGTPSAHELSSSIASALGDLDVCATRGWNARRMLAQEHSWQEIAPALLRISHGVRDRASRTR